MQWSYQKWSKEGKPVNQQQKKLTSLNLSTSLQNGCSVPFFGEMSEPTFVFFLPASVCLKHISVRLNYKWQYISLL